MLVRTIRPSDYLVDGGFSAEDEELLAGRLAQHLDVNADCLIVEVESAHTVLVFGLVAGNVAVFDGSTSGGRGFNGGVCVKEGLQLKAGSAGVSMARMFLMDLEVRWLRVDFSSRLRYAQLLFL